MRHWWDAIRTIEGRLSLRPNDFAEQLEQEMEEHRSTQYRVLIQRVPRLFNIVWAALLLVAVVRSLYFAFHWGIL